jgi:Fic family protein
MQTFRNLEKHLGQGAIPPEAVTALGEVEACRGRSAAFRRQNQDMLETLVEIARIQSTESSNAIENIVAPHQRIVELVEEKTTPDNRSEQEITGYRLVLDQIHSSATAIPFRASIDLQLHRDLYSFTNTPGGKWKSTQNEVAEFDAEGNKVGVIFKGTTPFETPAAMAELHDRFNKAVEENRYPRLYLIAAFVFDFLMVHPFNDGNGRMSRLLTLLVLYQADHDVGRFISLERLIEDSKETYYESLRKSTADWERGEHDIWPWINYFLGILQAAYRQFEERIGDVASGRGAKRARIHQFIRSRASDEFTFEEVSHALPDISAVHIRQEMRKLHKAGAVQSPGRGKRTWRRLKTGF